jgi:effector-binding domain-containing protein
VYATVTPAGEAAVAIHRDPYNRLNEAHDTIREWMAAIRRESAGHSWEIYGDPAPDPADTETTVVPPNTRVRALWASRRQTGS